MTKKSLWSGCFNHFVKIIHLKQLSLLYLKDTRGRESISAKKVNKMVKVDRGFLRFCPELSG